MELQDILFIASNYSFSLFCVTSICFSLLIVHILIPSDTKPIKKPTHILIVALAASEGKSAGYLMSYAEQCIQYYKKNSKIENMENFVKTLLFWREKIQKCGQLEIYTEDKNFFSKDNEWAIRLIKLLQHFDLCDQVTLVNKNLVWLGQNSDEEKIDRVMAPVKILNHSKEEFEFKMSNLYPDLKEITDIEFTTENVRVLKLFS